MILFGLMNFPGSCSILAGFLVGYLFVFGVLSFCMVSKVLAEWFEEKFLCCVKDNQNFVKQS